VAQEHGLTLGPDGGPGRRLDFGIYPSPLRTLLDIVSSWGDVGMNLDGHEGDVAKGQGDVGTSVESHEGDVRSTLRIGEGDVASTFGHARSSAPSKNRPKLSR
jgi:hypothetical protein